MAKQKGRGFVFSPIPQDRELFPEHVHVEDEELNQDEKTSSVNTANAAKEADDMRRIHIVYADYFVSFMRVRYAWGIFALLVCWLMVDIIALFSHATGKLDLYIVHTFAGIVAGLCLGSLGAYSYWSSRNKDDVEATFKLPRGSVERLDLREKNIQLRLWRILSITWICMVSSVLGAVLFRIYAWWQYNDSHEIPFQLTDAVLVTLISSTTASVIGIFLIVLHWLFPQSLKEDYIQKKNVP